MVELPLLKTTPEIVLVPLNIALAAETDPAADTEPEQLNYARTQTLI